MAVLSVVTTAEPDRRRRPRPTIQPTVCHAVMLRFSSAVSSADNAPGLQAEFRGSTGAAVMSESSDPVTTQEDYWNRTFRSGQYATPPAEPTSTPDDSEGGGGARRRRRSESASVEFGGALVPLQIRVPQELVQSLRLLSIDQNKTVSEIVLESLTSGVKIDKAWVSRRKTG